MCERAIERRLSGQPGACLTSHPWKAKDVLQRLQLLEQELARISREMNEWDQERYERETADWAGRLSETWERLINMEVVGKIVDRASQEVRPRMFRVLARITENDDREFQSSYARCSRWARRHDKSINVNYVAPALDELTSEVSAVRQWYDRVRKYSSEFATSLISTVLWLSFSPIARPWLILRDSRVRSDAGTLLLSH